MSGPKPPPPVDPAAALLAIADVAPVVLAYLDRDERFVFANRYYQQRFGRTVKPGALAREVLGPAYDALRPHLLRALAGETVSFETPVDRPDGTRLWATATYLPHRDASGAVQGVVAVSEDVTARKLAEERLRDRERREHEANVRATARHRALSTLTSSPPVLEVRAQMGANIGAQLARGAARVDVLLPGRAPLVASAVEEGCSLAPPPPHPGLEDCIRSGLPALDLQPAAPLRASLCVPLRAGASTVGALTVISETMAIGPDDLPGFAELGLTLAWALENARLFSEQQQTLAQLEAFLQHAPTGLSFLDRDLRYLRINRVLSQINGVPVEDTVGRTLYEVAPQVASAVAPLMRHVLETGEAIADLEVQGAGGRTFLVNYYPVPRPALDGGGVAAVGAAVTEITARKAFERRLEHAIEQRDEFVSVASHELRTPLTALALRLQRRRMMFDRGQVPDPAALLEDTRVEERQVQRLSRLVEDMLGVTRMRDGGFKLDREPVELGALAREVASRLRDTLDQAGCPLELELSEVTGLWDRARLEQVVVNLLTNATRYAPRSPVTLAVRREGMDAVLEVRDRGPGITATEHERIFQRFERATREKNVVGLGLGLYVCRQIAHGHGGSITVESAEGEGATFRVRLPLQPTP